MLSINVSDTTNITDVLSINQALTINVSETSATVIVDSFSETNQNSSYSMYGSGTNYIRVGQAFTASVGAILTSAKFYLQSVNSPTGTMTASLFALTGTYGTNAKPTGSALAVSDAVSISAVTSSFSLITFVFTGINQYQLQNGSQYGIEIEYSGADRIRVGADTSSPTHNGNAFYYVFIGSGYGTDSGIDVCFYVYGINGGFGVTDVVSGIQESFLTVNVSDTTTITDFAGVVYVNRFSVYLLSDTPTNNFAFLETSANRSIARTSNGDLYTVYNAYKPSTGWYTIRISKSTDQGANWTQAELYSYASGSSFTPKIAIDSTDTIHVVWEGYGATNNPTKKQILYIKGTWSSWGAKIDVTDATTENFVPCISIDSRDVVHLSWYGFSSAVVNTGVTQNRYCTITNGLVSAITDLSDNPQAQGDTDIAIDNQNNVYVIWYGVWLGSTYTQISCRRKDFATQTWGARELVIGDANGNKYLPTATIDMNDNVLCSYFDGFVGANKVGFIIRSPGTSGSWGTPTTFTGQAGFVYLDYSAVSVDKANNYYLVFSKPVTGYGLNDVSQIFYVNNVGGSWGSIQPITNISPSKYFQTRPGLLNAIWPKVGSQKGIPKLGTIGIWCDSNATNTDQNASNILGFNDYSLVWQTDIYTPPLQDISAITESVTITISGPLSVSKSDTTAVTEYVLIINPLCSISVSDTTTITDSNIISVRVTPSLFDTTISSENVNLLLNSYINMSDSSVITENISLSVVGVTTLQINISDTTTITDSDQSFIPSYSVSILDTISVSENILIFIPALVFSVNDSSSILETVTIVFNANNGISDSTAISEAVSVSILLVPTANINVNDSTVLSELSNLTLFSYINRFDTTVLVDFPSISEVGAPPTPAVFDSISISESGAIYITKLFVNVSDSISINELNNSYITNEYITSIETTLISESIVLSVVSQSSSISLAKIKMFESRHHYVLKK